MAGGEQPDDDGRKEEVEIYISDENSLLCLPRGNPAREACITVYTHKYFHITILAIILANTLSMLFQYSKVPGVVDQIWYLELSFTIAFTVEMLIKVTALGFCAHKGSYLREGWNILDCVIVVASLTSQTGLASDFSVIKLLRVLRPLRALSRVKGMKALMGALFVSIPQIVDNVFLLVFLIFIFAILGLQLFGGVLHRRCYVTAIEENNDAYDFPFLQLDNPDPCGGSYSCPAPPGVTTHCDVHRNLYSEEPLNYDNIWQALLLVFKVVSQDDWPEDMNKLMSSASSYSWVFYISCTVLGAFFGTNMFLAVLITAYYNNKTKMEDPLKTAAEIAQRHSDAPMLLSILKSFKHAVKDTDITLDPQHHVSVNTVATVSTHSTEGGDEGGEGVATNLPTVLQSVVQGPEALREMALFGVPDAAQGDDEILNTHSDQQQQQQCPPADPTLIEKIRLMIEQFVTHKVTEQVILFATVVNILVLAVDHHKIDEELAHILEVVNLTCTILFTCEISLKLIGMGPRRTLRDGYNCFDLFLVAVAIPDLVSGSSSAFTAFRAFRMLRALKVVRRWPSIHKLLQMTTSCFKEGVYVSFVVLLQIFIFSIMGMEFFEGKFESQVRPNFNTLWEAALASFIVITGESWAGVMKNGMLATNGWSAVYFLLLFMVGNFVLVNVFIAIILDKMDENMLNDAEIESVDGLFPVEMEGAYGRDLGKVLEQQQKELSSPVNDEKEFGEFNDLFATSSGLFSPSPPVAKVSDASVKRRQRLRRMTKTNADGSQTLTVYKRKGYLGMELRRDEKVGSIVISVVEKKSPAEKAGLTPMMTILAVNDEIVPGTVGGVIDLMGKDDTFTVTVKVSLFERAAEEESDIGVCESLMKWAAPEKDYQLLGTSFFIFADDSPFRSATSTVIHSKPFDYFILASIVANLVFLMLEHPKASASMHTAFHIADYVFTIIFVLEMLLKILVLGLWSPAPADDDDVYPPDVAKPYLRDTWNRVDAFVAVTAVIGLVGTPGFSLFRSLRALRLIIRSNELRVIVQSLIRCLPSVTRSIVLCGFLLFVFGILGVQLFKGTFYYCTDPDVTTEGNCTGYYDVNEANATDIYEVEANRTWARHTSHFDHLGASVFTLFEVAVGDGWAVIMFNGIDATSVGKIPRYNSNPWAAVFFVSFFVIGNFFAMNLIVGTLISEFLKMRVELGPWALLTEPQREYLQGQKILKKILSRVPPPPPPLDPIRAFVHKIVTSAAFDNLITLCIILNMFTMSTTHYRQSEEWSLLQRASDYAFTGVFILEVAVKVVALGPKEYWTRNWNKFDFLIVVVATVALLIPTLEGASSIKVLRVGRLFRLVKKAKGLQKLFNTMLQDGNVLFFANAGMLLLSVFFVFGVAGVDLFGRDPHEGALNKNTNFDTVPQAMLMLFTVSTTEGWIECRESATAEKPFIYVAYFLLFMVIGSFMMLNLFAAVVVEILQEQDSNDKNLDKVKVVEDLCERWETLFGKDTKTIHVERVIEAVRDSTSSRRQTFAGDTVSETGDPGLVPPTLRCLPRLRTPTRGSGTAAQDPFVVLPTKDTDYVGLLAYLSAVPIPISSSNEVSLKDLLDCYTYRLYGMVREEIKMLHKLKLVKFTKGTLQCELSIAHWFAADKIRRTWLETRERRKRLKTGRNNKTAVTDNPLSPSVLSDDTPTPQPKSIIKQASSTSLETSRSNRSVSFCDDHSHTTSRNSSPKSRKSSQASSRHASLTPPTSPFKMA